jgi:hypothetical protein
VPPATLVLKFHWRPVRGAPTVAPNCEGYDDRFKIHPHFCWSVAALRFRIVALAALEQTRSHESIQPFRKDVRGDREAPLEVGKAGPVNGVRPIYAYSGLTPLTPRGSFMELETCGRNASPIFDRRSYPTAALPIIH